VPEGADARPAQGRARRQGRRSREAARSHGRRADARIARHRRKLSEAASGIRDNKIKEKIRYSKSLLGSGAPEQYARNFEEEIGANIDQLRKKLDEALVLAGQQGRDRSGDAVDKARELARGVDSLGRRMQERGQQNAQRQRAEGQQGQRRSAGRDGQQGQSGKEGRRAKRPAGPERQRRISRPGSRPEGKEGSQARADNRPGSVSKGQGGQQGGRKATATPWAVRNGGWGGGDNRAGGPYGYYFGPDDIRQFRGEARRWAQEGQALRNMLREQNVDPKEFDEIMRRLRELDSERVYQDVEELARCRPSSSEGLKRFEYALRRKVGDETDRAVRSAARKRSGRKFKALVRGGTTGSLS
jgi:hypothetical protein